jgi:hypothetical protein
MRQALTTVLAVALLVGLGALAVLALPNANAPLAAAPVVSAAAPDAPEAAQNYNMVAVPLNSTAQMSSFDAAGLAALAGSGVQRVLRLDASAQVYQTYYPPTGAGTNFQLVVGDAYWLLLDKYAGSVLSFVGDVPPPSGETGAVKFTLYKGSPCKYNDISIPLDRSDIIDAASLAAAIGGVDRVLQLNASSQTFQTYYPATGAGTNFLTQIGYPYRVCLNNTAPAFWP